LKAQRTPALVQTVENISSYGQFSLPAYARSTSSDSEHALASDIRQPITHMFITPMRVSDRLPPKR